VLGSSQFKRWFGSQRPHEGDLVLLNNSFLLRRDGISVTRKSGDYLCVRIGEDDRAVAKAWVASVPGGLNSQFKLVPSAAAATYQLSALRVAVEEQRKRLGVIVFSLVGKVGSDEPASASFPSGQHLRELVFDPTQTGVASISGVIATINRLDDIDVVWQALETAASDGNHPLGSVGDSFETTFSALQENAGLPVDIDEVKHDTDSILSHIVTRLEEQIAFYKVALDRHNKDHTDGEALNEVLRIAYNFADGASTLLKLVVGVSDTKPLLFWLTIREQFDLAAAFAALPFAVVGTSKPSLDKYRLVVAAARNQVFHDLFSFGRPFHVRLSGAAFEGATLRLFRDYARKSEAALHFEDRSLVELLQSFTRTPERQLPIGFWDHNLEVMNAVLDVAAGLRTALVNVAAPQT
jgi:hypothetical protein